MRRKVGVTAEFPHAGEIVIGTAEAAIRVVAIDHDPTDGTLYFEIQVARGYFPGKGERGRTQAINGTVAPGEPS